MAVATPVGIGGGFLRTQADRFVLVLPVHVGWNGYRGSEVRGIEDGHTLCQMSVDAAKSAREYALFFILVGYMYCANSWGLGRTATSNLY